MSCNKESENLKIAFNVSINDLAFENKDVNFPDNIPDYKQSYTGGIVIFSGLKDTFTIDTRGTKIEDIVFKLEPGTYDIEIQTPLPLYGQEQPSFKSLTKGIDISELTDTIAVHGIPTCALVVVKDELDQLENGAFIIERKSIDNDNFKSYPLIRDSINKLYYTYVFPDTTQSVPNTFLWFYDSEPGEEKGGLHTSSFEVGYKYLIKVLE